MPMLASRKHFLQQAGFAIAGSLLPHAKLFPNQSSSKKLPVDLTHPSDCTLDLRSPIYPLTYIKEADFQYHKGSYPGIIKDQLYILENAEPPGIVGDCLVSLPSSDVCSPTNSHSTDVSVLEYRVYYRVRLTKILQTDIIMMKFRCLVSHFSTPADLQNVEIIFNQE